ncbi:hypothetical protein CK203_057616 [Vitis vinifera]|uniref:Reverse transcriptase/retrotransposon-derived protein RNase H-like domain-containing protein n=1 Tax=Vitis vinifera TaxID=29760 RepID=A0A438GNI1_VITVI|nr:hypothetical protein CK203_057616 [Vitis vinifera]
MTYHMDWVILLLRRMHDTWCDCAGIGATPRTKGFDCVPEAVEIHGIQQVLGQMCLSYETTEPPEAMIVASPSLNRAKDMEKTSFITEWGTYCYRVMPFGLKNVGATYQRAATTLFHDMMHRDVEFKLRLNPKKCTFGVTFGKLLEHIVSERGIEVDLKKIRAILDMPAPRTEREIRGFLGRLHLVPPTPGRPLLLYLSISDMALGCMLAQLNDSGKKRVIYYLICYTKSVKGALLQIIWLICPYLTTHRLTMISLMSSLSSDQYCRWRLYFDGAANQLGFGICILLISLQGDHIPGSVQLAFFDQHRLTNNIVEYEACITENQFVDALATLASVIEIPAGVIMRPLLIETRSTPAYYYLIGDIEDQDELPWYHDIYQFLLCGVNPESASPRIGEF